jgi:hypothetical protein
VSLVNILHNIKDHAEAITAIMFQNQATGDLRVRLLSHIAQEEGESQLALEKLRQTQSLTPEEERACALGIDHSKFLVDFISGKEISPALAQELLHHFIEEHDQNLFGLNPIPPVTPPSSTSERGWTVGSLISRSSL